VHLDVEGKEAWKTPSWPWRWSKSASWAWPFDLPAAKLVGAAAGAKVAAEVELP